MGLVVGWSAGISSMKARSRAGIALPPLYAMGFADLAPEPSFAICQETRIVRMLGTGVAINRQRARQLDCDRRCGTAGKPAYGPAVHGGYLSRLRCEVGISSSACLSICRAVSWLLRSMASIA